jgi:hypothetical protein
MKIVANWFRRYFSDPQIIFLAILLLILFAVVITMGNMLMPVLASIVIAYLLEGLVGQLERRGWPRLASVMVVYVAFLVFVALGAGRRHAVGVASSHGVGPAAALDDLGRHHGAPGSTRAHTPSW